MKKNDTSSSEKGTAWTRSDRRRLYAALIIGAVALAVLIKLVTAQSPAEAYVLWILAAFISFVTVRSNPSPESRTDKPVACVLLTAAILLAAVLPDLPNWTIWLGICSALAWYSGAATALRLSGAALIFTVFAPAVGYLYTLLSFPLSRISTAVSVFILRLFGINCAHENAVIFLGSDRIAVTAACSGIDLLAALLLLGWIVVYFEHRNPLTRTVHYLTLLPIIIFCNSLRLVIVIAWSLVIGESAFGTPVHVTLGYAVVVGSVLLLFAVGKLFPTPETHEK